MRINRPCPRERPNGIQHRKTASHTQDWAVLAEKHIRSIVSRGRGEITCLWSCRMRRIGADVSSIKHLSVAPRRPEFRWSGFLNGSAPNHRALGIDQRSDWWRRVYHWIAVRTAKRSWQLDRLWGTTSDVGFSEGSRRVDLWSDQRFLVLARSRRDTNHAALGESAWTTP